MREIVGLKQLKQNTIKPFFRRNADREKLGRKEKGHKKSDLVNRFFPTPEIFRE